MKKRYTFLIILSLFSSIWACKELEIKRVSKIKIKNIYVTKTKIQTTAEIVDLSDALHDEYGLCWSLSPAPTVNDSTATYESIKEQIVFYHDISSFLPDTFYYIRPFIKENDSYIYGKEVGFETLPVIRLSTDSVVNVNNSSADVYATINDIGTGILDYGFYLSTDDTIDESDIIVSKGERMETGIYSTNFADLSPNATYWVQAFANDDEMVQYGDIISFSTTPDAIQIISPTADSVWIMNQSYPVMWSDNFPERVLISLFLNGEYYSAISNNEASDGLMIWEIPQTLPSSENYQIKISQVSNAEVFAISDSFSVQSPYYIRISAPTAEMVWKANNEYEIVWQDNIVEKVSIKLYKNDEYYATLSNFTSSDGSYMWSIPSTIPPGDDYQLVITSVANEFVYARSPYFAIE